MEVSHTTTLFCAVAAQPSASTSTAECPLVRRNDDVSLSEVRQLIDSGQIHNVVISPGPGSPHAPKDVGE